jgi:hypothetical protein
MTERDQFWTHRIALSDVPEDGLHVALEADEAVRTALARIANLRDLPHLEASFDLRRKGAGGLHVAGEVNAKTGQNCVVTLDPIEKNMSEAIDLVFFPERAEMLGEGEAEVTFGMTDSEAPEPLSDGIVDLGAIATEYFLLGIDPYPRKDGAVFEAAPPPDPAADSPFAALGALKKPPATGK